MNQSKKTETCDDFFELKLTESQLNNKRSITRYIRTDLRAVVYTANFFGFKEKIPVQLHDISCKGALIESPKKLILRKKIILALRFKNGKVFQIKAMVIRKTDSHHLLQYGLKFERYNNKLGDYLFETQKDLIFK
ncbi:MAG: PilZ domain-containing protein [Methylococcaceae bacterium]|jgi:hypothetical protein